MDWKKCKTKHKKAGVALIVHKKDIRSLICVRNNLSLKYTKKKLREFKGRNRNSMITAGRFNILSQQLKEQENHTIERTQKVSKNKNVLKTMIENNHLHIIDIYRALCPIIIE